VSYNESLFFGTKTGRCRARFVQKVSVCVAERQFNLQRVIVGTRSKEESRPTLEALAKNVQACCSQDMHHSFLSGSYLENNLPV